jgi:hypothetical protein
LLPLKRRELRAVLKMFYEEGWVDFTLADLEFMYNMSPLFNAEFGIRHRGNTDRKDQVLHSVFAAVHGKDETLFSRFSVLPELGRKTE